MVPSLRFVSSWITTQGFECIKTSPHSASSFAPDPSSAWRFHDLPSICHLDTMIHCFFHSVPMILKFPTVCPSVPYDPAFPPLSQCLSSPLLCLFWWRKAHNDVHRHHQKSGIPVFSWALRTVGLSLLVLLLHWRLTSPSYLHLFLRQ